MTVNQPAINALQQHITDRRSHILDFLRELVAIESINGDIRAAGERCEQEMQALGYDAIWWDKMGNLVGRIGSEDADRILLYDTHIDTVGTGSPDEWDWSPFEGKIEDGVLYARGAGDAKGCTPGMVYGAALARDNGLLPDDMALYIFCNMEEINEGAAPNAFVQTEGIFPDFVVIGEPTGLNVYRGQKGRTEYQIHIQGKSAHAASNHLGDNALYKALPVIEAIQKRQDTLPADDFLGQARITVTDVTVEAGSRNVVPGAVTVYVDRRLIPGETARDELAQLEELTGHRDDIHITIPEMTDPSYTGFIFPLDAIYPAWVLPDDAPFVQTGLQTGQALGLNEIHTGKWDFSTNGVYWAGKLNIPTIGFGPGDEQHAHTVLDQVRLDDVVQATAWYSLLPAMLTSEPQS